MDYQAIYDRFIGDRLEKQPTKPHYFERHHIKPRKLGGDDGGANIIRLIPEDHFFAHLLLAKIHGGRMWAPIALMAGIDRYSRRARNAYGWARRAMAQAASGSGAHQFDTDVRTFEHKDGRTWSGLQSEMPAGMGISKSFANMLLNGRVKSAKGWSLPGVVGGRKGGAEHPMYRREVHHFCHVDGREFIGTQFEFHKQHGIVKPAACKLARGEAKVWNGWHLKGTVLPKVGRSGRWSRLAQTATSSG